MLRKEALRTGRLANGRKFRMYDAAVTTDLNEDFPVSITSSNAEILTSTSATRARYRRLDRDNPYASGITWSYVANVGGEEPFRLEMNAGNWVAGKFVQELETNRMIEAAWKDAGKLENCCANRSTSRTEFYWQCIASMVRDGGIICRHRRAYPKNKYGYAIEPIEIDRLDHFYNSPSKAGTSNEIQFSIEMDEWHAPIAYWILTRHPGDIFAYSNQPRYRERVSADEIAALFSPRFRAGQYVGISMLASVVQRLHRIDQYDIAEMTAATNCAIRMGFFTKDANTTDEYVGDVETEDGIKINNMKAGVNLEELPQGYDYKEVNPTHPVSAYSEFTDQNLRSVAQGAHLAHSTVSGNYAGMSFSTGRLEKQPEKDTYKMMQEHVKKYVVHPHFNEWLKYAILSGQINLPITRLAELQDAAIFHAKRWPYINPTQDVQADILGIEAGLTSRSAVIAESERGGDVELVNSEIASDKACDELHDLDFSGNDPTVPTLPTGSPDDPAQPPPKKGGKQTIKK